MAAPELDAPDGGGPRASGHRPAYGRCVASASPSVKELGAHGLPTVLVWHSPGGYPFEIDGLAPMAERAGVRVVGVEREALPSAEVGPLRTVVREALDVLGPYLPEHFGVLGWSGGAPFAWGAAAEAPARVERVVAVAPLVGWLRGPGAMPAPSERLEAIRDAAVPEPARRQLAVVAEPWGFELRDTDVPSVVWYGGRDAVIPPALVEARLGDLPDDGAPPLPGGAALPPDGSMGSTAAAGRREVGACQRARPPGRPQKRFRIRCRGSSWGRRSS